MGVAPKTTLKTVYKQWDIGIVKRGQNNKYSDSRCRTKKHNLVEVEEGEGRYMESGK